MQVRMNTRTRRMKVANKDNATDEWHTTRPANEEEMEADAWKETRVG